MRLSEKATVHGPGLFKTREFIEWIHDTPDDLLGLDVESTPIENSKKSDSPHKREIYYPEFKVRTIQTADHDDSWVLDLTIPEHKTLVELAVHLGKEFVSFTGIDQRAVRRSTGINIDSITHDCHHLATLVYPGGFQNGLKALSLKHLDSGLADAEKALDTLAKETAPKGCKVGEPFQEHKWAIDIHETAFWMYAGLDAVYVLHLYDVLAALVHEPALIGRERWLGTLSVGQQHRGLLVDREYAQARYEEVETLHTEAGNRLKELWNAPPTSPRRIEWLQDNGLPLKDLVESGKVKLTDGGKSGNQRPSIDKDTLKFLVAEYQSDSVLGPALSDMLTVSENSNLKTNLRGLLANMDVNNRVHPSIRIMGAITGRQSVTGPAIQTYKKDDPRLRGCFIADPGMSFVSCDFQAVEVRVAAALSEDKALAEMVCGPGSMHLRNAFAIFGEHITKTDPRYRIAKIGTFSALYGAGAFGISGQLGITLKEAQEFKALLLETYPEAFYNYPRRMAKLGEVTTEWGRVIPLQRGFEYKAGNYMIQSSARELLVDAVRRLVTKYKVPSEWVSLLVHDECILQSPIDKVSEVAHTLQEAMTDTYRGIPITSDVEILGERWKGVSDA